MPNVVNKKYFENMDGGIASALVPNKPAGKEPCEESYEKSLEYN